MKSKISAIFTISITLFLYSCNLHSDFEAQQYLNIYMHYGFRDEVDTFHNQLTKDLVLGGTITVDFTFTTEEQMQIEEAIILNDFFNLPDTIQYVFGDSMDISINPDPGIQYLRVDYNKQDKTVYWTYPLPNNNNAQVILSIYQVVKETVESTYIYQELPDSRGSYN